MMTEVPAEQAWISLREGWSGEEGVKLAKKYLHHQHHHSHPQIVSQNLRGFQQLSTFACFDITIVHITTIISIIVIILIRYSLLDLPGALNLILAQSSLQVQCPCKFVFFA